MSKIFTIVPVFLDGLISDSLEEGKLYISKEYGTAIHLCACGCQKKTITPIRGPESWTLIEKDNIVSLDPSIGNFSGENPYHAHYYITNNEVRWCP